MIRFLSIVLMSSVVSVLPVVSFAQTADGKLPMRKTDSQITREMESYPFGWDKMTKKEQDDYSKKLMEDRIIITTQNFKVIETGFGTKLCTLNAVLVNNTSRTLHKLHVNYKWKDTSTYMTFENIPPAVGHVGTLSLTGSVCSEILNGADYEIGDCQADGLTEEQCKLRIFEIK